MTPDTKSIAERLVETARKYGASAADAAVVSTRSFSIDVRESRLEKAESSESIQFGLRVFLGEKSACVSASNPNFETFKEVALRAVAMANVAPRDEFSGLAEPDELSKNTSGAELELCDDYKCVKNLDVLKHMAFEIENSALAVEGVTQCEGTGINTNFSDFYMATSNGFSAGYQTSYYQLFCSAIAEQNSYMEKDFSIENRIFFCDLPQPSEIGLKAGQRAAERLSPRRPPTGNYPVLFSERISSSLISHLISAISGNAITRGSSWMQDNLGKAILPKGLNLREDPFRKRVFGSRPFDGEGLPTTKKNFVENGELTSWVLDLRSSRILKLKPTGNGSRSLSSPPTSSVGNLELIDGTSSYENLLLEMGTGLLVTSLIGSTINPITGDYSRGASGFWVENGQVKYPVNECTIAGNLKDILKNLIPANDFKNHLSRVIPSLLVDGITIAGK